MVFHLNCRLFRCVSIAFSLVTVTVSSLLIDAIKEWNGGGGG